jgi:hypothetical protein
MAAASAMPLASVDDVPYVLLLLPDWLFEAHRAAIWGEERQPFAPRPLECHRGKVDYCGELV